MSGKQRIVVSGKKNMRTKKLFNFLYLVVSFILLTTYRLPLSFAASGASFLKLGVGARALGLGSAYTSVANDVTALYWNPGGLAQLKNREVSAMHAELFADTRFDFFGYAHPTSKGTWSIGAVYLSQGSIEGRSETRTKSSDFTASDLSVTFGASKYVSGRTSLGLNLKVLQSKMAGNSSSGFALDAGSIWKISDSKLEMGFAVQNLGPQMKFREEGYPLPLSLASGVSYPIFSRLLISADLKYQPYDTRTSLSIGTEFSPVSMLSLRVGYLTNAIRAIGSKNNNFEEKVSNLSGFGLGIGFKIGSSAMDYSFTPAGELGNSQRIYLSIRF